MPLWDRLCELGSRLRIIQVAAPPDAKPLSKVPMRTVTLANLAAEVRVEQVRALADAPAELSLPFEQICRAAGAQPPAHGWTVPKLIKLLRNKGLGNISRPAAQGKLVSYLASAQAPVEDLVKDAVARDQAVDKFAAFLKQKVEQRQRERNQRLAALTAQIKDLQAEAERLKGEIAAEQQCYVQWRRRKLAHEKELAWAISFLLDKPVVSVDEEEAR
jgi:hypothetical protein